MYNLFFKSKKSYLFGEKNGKPWILCLKPTVVCWPTQDSFVAFWLVVLMKSVFLPLV